MTGVFKAYLVAAVDTEAVPPKVVGAGIYSSNSRCLTTTVSGRHMVDIAEAGGNSYAEAKENLLNYVRSYPRTYQWAVDLLSPEDLTDAKGNAMGTVIYYPRRDV